MWDEIKLAIDAFMNSSVGAAMIAAAGFITAVWGFVSKTSFGKRALNEAKKVMEEKTEEVKAKAEEMQSRTDTIKKITEDVQEEVKAFTANIQEQYNSYTKQLEEKLNAVYSKFELYQDKLFVILEAIPNAKVQEQIKLLKEELIEHEGDMEGFLGETYSSIKAEAEQTANEKILSMNEKLLELENKLNEVLNNGEEREENQDTDTAQENA